MPYKMSKAKGGGYRVSGPSGVHAKHSTKANAEAQMRLLRGIEHGMVPRKQMNKSVHGSTPYSDSEIMQGYRSMGTALYPKKKPSGSTGIVEASPLNMPVLRTGGTMSVGGGGK